MRADRLLKLANYIETRIPDHLWNFDEIGNCETGGCAIGWCPKIFKNDNYPPEKDYKSDKFFGVKGKSWAYLFSPRRLSSQEWIRPMLNTPDATRYQVAARIRKFVTYKLTRAHKEKQYWYAQYSHARNGKAIAESYI